MTAPTGPDLRGPAPRSTAARGASTSQPLATGLVIAIEASARRASVAAALGERIVDAELESTRAHGSDLLPVLRRLAEDLGSKPADLRAVLVGIGPGSYTGLRVAAATALGLARASGAALRAVPSGEALVFGALRPGEQAMHLLDARSGGLTFGHYRRLDEEVEVLAGPIVLVPAAVNAAIAGTCPIFSDETAPGLAGLATADRARVRTDTVPLARDVLVLGLVRLARFGPHAPHEIEPLYLRAFAPARPG